MYIPKIPLFLKYKLVPVWSYFLMFKSPHLNLPYIKSGLHNKTKEF